MVEAARKKRTEKKKKRVSSLIDVVFSWSLEDVMNKNLYRDKVNEIPETFLSTDVYLKSFIYPLLEETRADLYSNITNSLRHAQSCEALDVIATEDFKLPKNLFYYILLDRTVEGHDKSKVRYKPESGDLIALSDLRPKRIEDLNRPKMSYILALVQGMGEGDDDDDPDWFPPSIKVLSSKPINFREKFEENWSKGDKLFVVHLTNLTTNDRIWRSLIVNPSCVNLKIIRTVLQSGDHNARTVLQSGNCAICTHKATDEDGRLLNATSAIQSFGLDNSQEEAILNCVKASQCRHQNTVKLIWGPPGTGKTKTVASLLSVLFNMKCRTLTCAPTNIAVIGVAKKFMELVRGSLQYDSYGLGDIVLFGNKERMKFKIMRSSVMCF